MTAIILPDALKTYTVITYPTPAGVTFEIINKSTATGPDAKQGEVLESCGKVVGFVHTFKGDGK